MAHARVISLLVLIALPVMAAACGRINYDLLGTRDAATDDAGDASNGSPDGDAASDANLDAAPDADLDAGLDASLDASLDAGLDAASDAGTDEFCTLDRSVCFVQERLLTLPSDFTIASLALNDDGWLAVGMIRGSDATGGIEFFDPSMDYASHRQFFEAIPNTDYGLSVAECNNQVIVGAPGRPNSYRWRYTASSGWNPFGNWATGASRFGTVVDCSSSLLLATAEDRVQFTAGAAPLSALGPASDDYGAAAALLEQASLGRVAWVAIGAPGAGGGNGEVYVYGFNDLLTNPSLHANIDGSGADRFGTAVHLAATEPPMLDVGSARGSSIVSYALTTTGVDTAILTTVPGTSGLGQSIDAAPVSVSTDPWRVFGFDGGALLAVPGDPTKRIEFRRSEAGFGTIVAGGLDRIAVAAPEVQRVVVYRRQEVL